MPEGLGGSSSGGQRIGSPAAVQLPEQNEGQGADPENVKTHRFCSGFLDFSLSISDFDFDH